MSAARFTALIAVLVASLGGASAQSSLSERILVAHDFGASAQGWLVSGDTGPTEALWKAARHVRGLGAIILECAFPNRMESLARIAKHMTPELIRRELDKLPPDVPVLIFHVKPQFYDEIGEQLAEVSGSRITMLEQDKTYAL